MMHMPALRSLPLAAALTVAAGSIACDGAPPKSTPDPSGSSAKPDAPEAGFAAKTDTTKADPAAKTDTTKAGATTKTDTTKADPAAGMDAAGAPPRADGAGRANTMRTFAAKPAAEPTVDDAPLHLEDVETIALGGKIVHHDGKTKLHLTQGDYDLADHGNVVEIQLRRISKFDIKLADFTHDGVHYRTTGMTVMDDGTMELWARDNAGCTSPKLEPPAHGTAPHDVAFVVLAVEVGGNKVVADTYPIVRIPPMLTMGGR